MTSKHGFRIVETYPCAECDFVGKCESKLIKHRRKHNLQKELVTSPQQSAESHLAVPGPSHGNNKPSGSTNAGSANAEQWTPRVRGIKERFIVSATIKQKE